MRLQEQLSNGSWYDVPPDRVESYIDAAIRLDARIAEYDRKQPGRAIITREQVIEKLLAGHQVDYDTMNGNPHGTQYWYASIRDGEAYDRLMQGRMAKQQAYESDHRVLCDCGHYSTQPMNASLGTSCPDCYDRMSDGWQA